MSLAIDRWGFPGEIIWHSGALHYVRFACVKASGYEGEWEEFEKNGEKVDADGKWCWDKYPDYWQLLHFCDAEGIFVPGVFLDDVDLNGQFMLGNFDKLREEVMKLHTTLSGNQKLLDTINASAGRGVMDYVQELFNMMSPTGEDKVDGVWVKNFVMFS